MNPQEPMQPNQPSPPYQPYQYEAPQYTNSYQAGVPDRKKVLLWLFAGLAFIILLFIFLSISGDSVISVTAENGGSDGNYTYVLTNQQGKATKKTSSASTLKQTVKQGTYQVLVRRGTNSYLTFVTTKGFLHTTHVTAAMKPEVGRSFIGTKPNACMYYVYSTLLSTPCTSSYADLQVHQAATTQNPPLTVPVGDIDFFGSLEGIITTKLGIVTFAKVSPSGGDETPGHYAGLMQSNLIATGRTLLQKLDVNKIYTFSPYKDGFVAVDSNSQDIEYFTSLTAKPTQLKVTAPADTQYQAYLSQVDTNEVMVAYGNLPTNGVVDGGTYDTAQAGGKSFKSIVTIVKEGGQQSYPISGQLSSIQLCGTNKLCVVSNKTMQVYDISGKTARLLFSVSDVNSILPASNGIVAITSTDSFLIDVDKQEGYSQYNFGGYAGCGSAAATGGSYVLCVRKDNVIFGALYIDPNTQNDNIDKKLLDLAQAGGSDISFISPYKNILYVAPNYGATVYDPALHIYTFNDVTRNRVNKNIANLAHQFGLDTQPYQLINAGY